VRDVSWIQTAAASLVLGAAGGALFWHGVDGFRALTSEQARRSAVAAAPRAIPPVTFEDQNGRQFTLADYRGRPVAVDFIYTQCVTVCPLLSAGFQRIDRDQRGFVGTERLRLLSISFDPKDTPERLREYARRYRADGVEWRFARVRDPASLDALLRTFEVVVIPDRGGDFQHNAAVHLLNADGRLARVMDADVTLAQIRAAFDLRARRDMAVRE
jgi:protein SCO1